jgi:PhnB protein
MHEPLLDMAGKDPILANVNHYIVARHFPTSTRMSILSASNRQAAPICGLKRIFAKGCRERRDGSDYSMKTQNRVWQANTPQRRTSESKADEVSPFRGIRALHRGLGGLLARSMADSKMQKTGGNEMTTLTPYLLFDGSCHKAMEFYKSCFGGELTATKVKDSPAKDSMPAVQQEKILNARLRSSHVDISASDWLMLERTPTRGNTVCLFLRGGTFEELKALFERLSEGAEVTDPLQEKFFGTYGALNDKYGVRWMFHANKKL